MGLTQNRRIDMPATIETPPTTDKEWILRHIGWFIGNGLFVCHDCGETHRSFGGEAKPVYEKGDPIAPVRTCEWCRRSIAG